jgi:addiction module HigA family antidote
MSRPWTATGSARRTGRIRTHPGAVLREEFMRPLGLSAKALALALRVPATRIGAIIRHARPRAVTADTALRLARYFGTTPEFWLNPAKRLRPIDRPEGTRRRPRARCAATGGPSSSPPPL